MANFQESLGKLVPECQTILDSVAASDDGGGSGEYWNMQSSSQIMTTNIQTLSFFTGCIPFLTPNQQF